MTRPSGEWTRSGRESLEARRESSRLSGLARGADIQRRPSADRVRQPRQAAPHDPRSSVRAGRSRTGIVSSTAAARGSGVGRAAFTAARFAAMAFSRIVDREIDRRNPRTAMRELPRGILGVREASIAVAFAAAVFLYSAA